MTLPFDRDRYISPRIKNPLEANYASEYHERLLSWINDFDTSLDQDHEVGIRLVSFGQEVAFHVDDISYWNPSLMSFVGATSNGEPVELIQHVSQISILLMAMKRRDVKKPKGTIGFCRTSDEETDK